MKTDKPDFVGFVVWPIVGAVSGSIISTICCLKWFWGASPLDNTLVMFAVLGPILATSTWAGRNQPRCLPTLYVLTLLFSFVLYLVAPRGSNVRAHRVAHQLERNLILLILVNPFSIIASLTAIYGLTRWPRVLHDEAERSRLSELPAVHP